MPRRRRNEAVYFLSAFALWLLQQTTRCFGDVETTQCAYWDRFCYIHVHVYHVNVGMTKYPLGTDWDRFCYIHVHVYHVNVGMTKYPLGTDFD